VLRAKTLAAAALLVVLGATASAARAGQGLLIGVDDDSLEWTATVPHFVQVQRSLGIGAVRMTLQWSPGESAVLDKTDQTSLRRMSQAVRFGDRVVLDVYGAAGAAPTTPLARSQFCQYTVSALQQAPGVNDVVIWNEANSPKFWASPDPAAYEALLAQCYDAIHARRPWANVISSTSPHQNPAAFIAGLGAAYRASGRTSPIFDTFGHNAYPQDDAEAPDAQHAATSHSIDEGDYERLLAALTSAFSGTGQPVPGQGSVTIWYLEDGFQTIVPPSEAGLYDGTELDRSPIPALALSGQETSADVDQAGQLSTALELAYCQPAVGAFFNFQLVDDPDLAGWQSGLLWPDWTPKPSVPAFRSAAAAVAAGQVDCSRFPASVR